MVNVLLGCFEGALKIDCDAIVVIVMCVYVTKIMLCVVYDPHCEWCAEPTGIP